MTNVVECRRAGLDGLLDLVGGSALLTVTVTVVGAHGDHFTLMLGAAPMADVERVERRGGPAASTGFAVARNWRAGRG